jgi:hypothetical protein
MKDSSPAEPRYVGGTNAEHVLFVVSLCRFQHHSLALASAHYLTWGIVHVALHAIAFAVLGPIGPIALGVTLTAWAVRMDLGVGLLFGLMQLASARAAIALVPMMGMSTGVTVAVALGAVFGAIFSEARGFHVLIQGYAPRPPSAVASLPARQKVGFVPYFVFTFGPFFLTLDLAMRLLGYRKSLHRRANAIAATWHELALPAASPDSREMRLHRRAVAELA